MMFVVLLSLRVEWLGWLMPLFALMAALVGTYEVYNMALHKQIECSLGLTLAAAAAFIGAGAIHQGRLFAFCALAVVVVLLLAAFLSQMYRHGNDDALRVVPMTLFAPVYAALPVALGLQILWSGKLLLLFILLTVWATDIAAYYVGRNYGSVKLAPRLSPKKTREGALGGLAGCVGVALLFKLIVPSAAFELGWGEVLLLGLLFAVVGQLGDLSESILKRDAGVKDSGTSLAGHGGVLDRLDSLLFCFVIFYLWLLCSGRVFV